MGVLEWLTAPRGDGVGLGLAVARGGRLDLLGVVCGSEGQLGIVTEATVRLLAGLAERAHELKPVEGS